MELPAALPPSFSIAAESVFNEASSVSNAVSQFAVPLVAMTVFWLSVICSPKGSAALPCASADAGGAVDGKSPGDLVSAGGGAGVAEGAGGEGVGACAFAVAIPTKITGARAKRNKRGQFIRVFSLASFVRTLLPEMSRLMPAKRFASLR